MSDYFSEAAAAFPLRSGNTVDHLSWAKRIVYREERGDKHLMPVQVQFAKMALGMIEMPNGKR